MAPGKNLGGSQFALAGTRVILSALRSASALSVLYASTLTIPTEKERS